MPTNWLAVPHHQQRHPSDCLAACAFMALAYIGRPLSYERLLDLLEIAPDVGAPASKIKRLSGVVSRIIYTSGTFDEISAYLEQGLPCIAFVHTLQLNYWMEDTRHAVVITGLDQDADQIYLDDPYFELAPQVVSLLEFQLAWDEMDNRYAVLIP